jgi:DNA-binding HxlR family transcriptional regulator
MRQSSVTRAIRILGDRWSILVIRDAFQGVRRFEDFLERSGAPRATLTRRLRALVAHGILERIPARDAPSRHEYRLSERGRDLYPLSLVAWSWERRWAPRGAGIPPRLYHRGCGHEMRPELACAHCGDPLSLRAVSYRVRPGPPDRESARPARLGRLSSTTAATHRGSQSALTHIADIVGDPWTPLLVAASFFGLRRFDDFRRELGIASNILAVRLELLVRQRILVRRAYQRHPARHEYRLTDKGRDLFPYALVLNAWGDRWLASAAGPPYQLRHAARGHEAVPVVRCSHCHAPLAPENVAPARRPATPGPDTRDSRMAPAKKGGRARTGDGGRLARHRPDPSASGTRPPRRPLNPSRRHCP